MSFCSFFFNDTAPTEIYTLSLHDALPISLRYARDAGGAADRPGGRAGRVAGRRRSPRPGHGELPATRDRKSTPSELQSLAYLVCRLLLEKKKWTINITSPRSNM